MAAELPPAPELSTTLLHEVVASEVDEAKWAAKALLGMDVPSNQAATGEGTKYQGINIKHPLHWIPSPRQEAEPEVPDQPVYHMIRAQLDDKEQNDIRQKFGKSFWVLFHLPPKVFRNAKPGTVIYPDIAKVVELHCLPPNVGIETPMELTTIERPILSPKDPIHWPTTEKEDKDSDADSTATVEMKECMECAVQIEATDPHDPTEGKNPKDPSMV